ncbi:MAG: 3-oxoacyl-ACP synthase III family protein [Elusimicrobiota bacterium]
MTGTPFNILGMGWALPKTVIDNDFLHKEVGLKKGPDWVQSRLGIIERRTVLSKEYILKTKNADPRQAIHLARSLGETPVTLAVRAAQKALAHTGVRPDQIGMVVCNCDLPFDLIPATADYIAKALGIGSGPHIDLNTACSSFARHMKYLGDLNERAWPEFVLTVQTGAYTTRTDYSPENYDGYIWGDGAAAQLCSFRHPGRLKVEPMIFASEPAGADDVKVDATAHFKQDGAKIREFSIRKTVEMFETVASAKHLYAEDVYTVTHQANAVMMDSILGHLKLPKERHLSNVQLQGNIASAGMPSAVAQKLDSLHKGDQIVYAVLGAGLAWGGGYMEVQ